MKKIYLIILPLAFVGIISLFFVLNLNYENEDILIVSDIPDFKMTDLSGNKIDRSVFTDNEYKLINVWATWCINCKLEHGFLMYLKRENFKIIGLNYKDNIEKANKWLVQFGNPYKKNIFDQKGELGFELGVAGAPETYLVNKQNKILYKHIGIMNEDIWNQKFLPLINE
ncbi:MAG: DsbE family thiol:disulfide interchange protein [Gammaproteobacteria bacterium]|nr:MAG: DsbE family thiol:disulfide interchange protein [Gammaproteobacteria bacterium]|tara:strand:+ start:1471 stop:1980 length:510 start_codon:yes stop_codon:yes gene_type:complete